MESLRSSKKRKRKIPIPGSEWSNKELQFFKIKVDPIKDFRSFFGEDPPETFSDTIKELLDFDLSNVDILENINWKDIKSKQLARFIKDALAVTKTHRSIESAVDDFAKTLFQAFDYDDEDLCIRTREEINLDMCGSKTSAKPDVCIQTSNLVIRLLVQEDKNCIVANSKNQMGHDPESQVFAEAIAAFQENNKIRQRLDIPLKDSQLMPCITMLGTYPTFYLFNVTQQLAKAVSTGEEPDEVTMVKRYKIPMQRLMFGDVILSSVHRRHIFQCYTSLKKFVVSF